MYLLSVLMDNLWPIIAVIATTLIALGGKWIANQKWASDGVRDFEAYIEGYALRARDKFLVELQASKDPNSPGGTDVTPEEYSKIRQDLFDDFMNEVKGPARERALMLGEAVIKALIGKYLPSLFGKTATPPAATTSAPPATP